ncbi:MAG: hypothetical protein AAF715_10870 [Myxococcota bacterium]
MTFSRAGGSGSGGSGFAGSGLRRGVAGGLLLSLLALPFSACSNDPTQLVAGMTTQINVGRDLQTVGITVRLGGRFIFCQGYDVVEGVARLPSTLGVVPASGRNGEVPVEPVTIDVVGFRGDQTTAERFSEDCSLTQNFTPGDGDVRILRRRRMPYLPEEILYLPMPLRESCDGVACGEDETCIGGVCEPADIDNGTLERYADDLVFGDTNTCFSPERCLPLPGSLPAVPVGDPTSADWDCTYRLPLPADAPEVAGGQLNVEVIYRSFNTEILDLDGQEGFVLADADDPTVFRLAENLCTSQIKRADPKIIGIRGAALCPAKRALQPICDDELREIQQGGRSPGAEDDDPERAARCTVSLPLTAADSALYVLLDKSDSMREFFSPDSLQFALDLSLRNPVAAKTSIAFDYLSGNQTDDICSANPNPYETPLVAFGDAEAVQPVIAAELASPTGGIDANDGDLDLEIALAGAYTALSGATSSTGTFNRRAAIVVGNRQFEATCSMATDTLADLAQTAQTDEGLFTYVAVLEPGPTPPPGNPTAEGGAIATAGGTEVFDGVSDPAEGALAVQQVLNDLGSCVYDLEAAENGATDFVGIFDDIDAGEVTTELSYLDPVTLDRTDIDRNAMCTAATVDTVDGWNREGSVVRICGAPCAALRQTLDDTAAFFAVQAQPGPEVPIRLTVPCDVVAEIEDKVIEPDERAAESP